MQRVALHTRLRPGLEEEYENVHAVIPADGATAAPDLARKPSDQDESWSTFAFALPAQTEGALSVDVYQSRKGQGYIVNADVVANGIRYRRSANLVENEHRRRPPRLPNDPYPLRFD